MNLLLLRANDSLAVKDYIYYFICSEFAKRKIISLAKKAINQASISTNDLKRLDFNLPSIPEQTAISKILSESDNEINLANHKLKYFQQQKKGLMQVLLTGKKRVKTNIN